MGLRVRNYGPWTGTVRLRVVEEERWDSVRGSWWSGNV